jgi:hypothetical protein
MVKTTFRNTVDFSAVVDAERKAAFKALWMHGQAVDSQARKDKLVPIDTGTLRRTSVVTLARLPNPEEIYQVALSGGKPQNDSPDSVSQNKTAPLKAWVSWNTPYAEWLHETFRWKPRPPREEGGPKWAEIALAACKDKFADITARVFREFFR